jgi:hypothetical protein
MVVAAENNLIPYAGQHYPVQPYARKMPVANHERQQRNIQGQKFFRRPQSEINTPVSHLNFTGNLYNFKLFEQQPAFEQVGLVVDIYA